MTQMIQIRFYIALARKLLLYVPTHQIKHLKTEDEVIKFAFPNGFDEEHMHIRVAFLLLLMRK